MYDSRVRVLARWDHIMDMIKADSESLEEDIIEHRAWAKRRLAQLQAAALESRIERPQP